MGRIWIGALCAALAFALPPAACAAAGDAAGTVTVTDMAGRRVTAPFDPERIVCIGTGTLRQIVYLRAESKVVGVEDFEKSAGGRPYRIAHPELAALPRCGPGGPASINKKPDLEALLAVRPQVIFTTYMDASLADEVQRTTGIPVFVLSYGPFATFDDTVYDSLRAAGKVLNRGKRAEDVVAHIESLRRDLRARTAEVPESSRPSVYVGGVGHRGAHGIESTEQRYIPFEWTGANNVARRVKAGASTHLVLDRETLLKLDPDVVFLDGIGLALVEEDYRKRPEFYGALKAFPGGRVHVLFPFNFYMTNIGTALADAYAVGKILHPERFGDVDPEKKADEIYAFLVGKPVYGSMRKLYGPLGGKAPFLK